MKKIFTFFLLSAALAFPAGEAPASSPEDKLTADEVRAMQQAQGSLILFDARNPKSYGDEHIEGAVLPLSQEFYSQQTLFQQNIIQTPPDTDAFLKSAMEKYPKDAKIVTYCHEGCQASEVLMTKLKALGFKDVKFLENGIDAWKAKGYPTLSKASQEPVATP